MLKAITQINLFQENIEAVSLTQCEKDGSTKKLLNHDIKIKMYFKKLKRSIKSLTTVDLSN